MVDTALALLNNKVDLIIFTTSHQDPPDKQDCYYLALMAKDHYNNEDFATETRFCPYNPTDFRNLLDYYLKLIHEFKGEKIYFANSGGTPDMRAASYFAGIFSNVDYITINAREKKANATNFRQQENQILRHTVQKMLNVYDYEGIRNLPVSKAALKLSEDALNLYNLVQFNVDGKDGKKPGYEEVSKRAICLLINNMNACYKQGRYVDALGRIFRIEEAIGQLLFYIELKAKSILDNDDKFERIHRTTSEKKKNTELIKYEKLIKSTERIVEIVKANYSEIICSKDECSNSYPVFMNNTKVSLNCGKNFYYFFFRSINQCQEVYDFFEKLNNGYKQDSNKLQELRNSSIMGHGFKGISKPEIESVIGSYSEFLQTLVSLCNQHLSLQYEDVFEKLNKEILANL